MSERLTKDMEGKWVPSKSHTCMKKQTDFKMTVSWLKKLKYMNGPVKRCLWEEYSANHMPCPEQECKCRPIYYTSKYATDAIKKKSCDTKGVLSSYLPLH